MQFIHFEYSTPTDLSVVTLKSRQKPITWNRTEFRNFDQTCEKTYRAISERFFSLLVRCLSFWRVDARIRKYAISVLMPQKTNQVSKYNERKAKKRNHSK